MGDINNGGYYDNSDIQIVINNWLTDTSYNSTTLNQILENWNPNPDTNEPEPQPEPEPEPEPESDEVESTTITWSLDLSGDAIENEDQFGTFVDSFLDEFDWDAIFDTSTTDLKRILNETMVEKVRNVSLVANSSG